MAKIIQIKWTELQLEIAAKLKELGSQKAVVELGYNKGTVSKVAKKLRKGWMMVDKRLISIWPGAREIKARVFSLPCSLPVPCDALSAIGVSPRPGLNKKRHPEGTRLKTKGGKT